MSDAVNLRHHYAVKPAVPRLLREDEVKAIQWEADEVKKERDSVSFQLHKKEWECDSLKMEWYTLYTCVQCIHNLYALSPVSNLRQVWRD